MKRLGISADRGKNLLLSLLVVLLTLGSAELVLSLFHPVEFMQIPDKGGTDSFKQTLHRSSDVPDLSFELTPNRQKKYEGVWIRTNNHGMRDTPPLPIEDDSTVRIVALGDSFTFGFRVEGDASYPSVLEQQLNLGEEGSSFEVLNLGVCGYNTQDEARVLEHKGLTWRPDLVILGYSLNDPETDPVQPLNEFFREPGLWQRSNLARLLVQAKRGLGTLLWGGGDYYRYLHAEGHAKWSGVEGALTDIRELTGDGDIPVLVVIFPDNQMRPWSKYPYADLHRQIADAARAEGFAVIDLLESFADYSPRTMRVRRGDPHPSVLGHEVAAQAIYDWIALEL